MDVVCRIVAQAFQLEAFKKIQVFEKDRPLAPEARFIDVDAVVFGREGLLSFRVVSRKIAFAQQATGLLAELADAARDGAAIEIIADCFDRRRPAPASVLSFCIRHFAEGARQVGLDENFAFFGRSAAWHVNGFRAWPTLKYRTGASQIGSKRRIQGKALREFDRGLDDVSESHRPIVLESKEE